MPSNTLGRQYLVAVRLNLLFGKQHEGSTQ